MKIKFDEQRYQLEAIQSITGIFEGQGLNTSTFSGNMESIAGKEDTELGIGNNLELSEEDVLKNIRKIQVRNRLKKSEGINDWNFTVEMETGTGKTYVYTRTIFELNKRYGFLKFIIVVPGIAVREGVFKSLQITEEHFAAIYPEQHYHYFKYDSSKIEQVREFAASTNIEIMIITIDAFKKSFDDSPEERNANLIHREHDLMNGRRPIEFIQKTNPIVIIDEPQSVDNTEKAKEAIAFLNPLCKLRYSATPRESYNLMYRLSAIEAFEKKLVKRIEVLSVRPDDDFNEPHIKLLAVSNANGYKAKVEIDAKKKGGAVSRITTELNHSGKSDLYMLSGGRELYRGYTLAEINCFPGEESVLFSNGQTLRLGETVGGIDEDIIKRHQIREAIRAHLDKELKVGRQGIKVLTLFFVDKVENYRVYVEGRPWQKGKYAIMFEEEYRTFMGLPEYRGLFAEDPHISKGMPHAVHNGYFSRDKSGNFKNSIMKKDGSLRSSKEDESVFELIMKEKETLLSMETPLRFIFSHSALKEGWDNPNVFQICTLTDTKDSFTKRQKIGRGLRLAVNRDGERQYDESINVLTIVANESYHDFAESLQKEIEEETGTKFGFIEEEAFSGIPYVKEENGEMSALGFGRSAEFFSFLVKENYITKRGKVKDKLKKALVNAAFTVPAEFRAVKDEIEQIIKRSMKKLPVFNRKDGVHAPQNREMQLSDEFKQRWERISSKTTYSVHINTEMLKKRCMEEIKELKPFETQKIKHEHGRLQLGQSGIAGVDLAAYGEEVIGVKRRLPDILRYLQDETNLKRKTLAELLIDSGRLSDFEKNPRAFMENVMNIIIREKKRLLADGIVYERMDKEDCYRQALIDYQEVAEILNDMEHIKLFIKLPSSFTAATPLGNYNPDGAVLVRKEDMEKLYLFSETKGETGRKDISDRVADSYGRFKSQLKKVE